MSRPSLGTRVSEGARSGVVVGHPGRGNMVDVQFDDVPFVMRREASLLARSNPQEKDDPAKAQKHAVVQGIYESLVKKHLGRKNFRGRDGERIDVKALEKGTLSAEDVDGMVSRAFAIATGVGRKQGDISRESLTRTGTRTSITSTGEALSALRGGANPKTVERKLKAAGVSQAAIDRVLRLHAARGPGESDQRLEDFEITLTLRRAPTRARRPKTVAASEERAAPVRRKTRSNPWENRGEWLSNPHHHLRRNSTASTAVVVAGEAAALGPRTWAALARYGQASYAAAKTFLNSPFGSRVASTVVSVAISVLGRKVVESGKLSKAEVGIVQDALAAETGAVVPGNIVAAAVASGAP